MRCSGRGKDIPFTGVVCPYCQRDKRGDQRKRITGVSFRMIGGAVGYFASGFGAAIGGSIEGGIVGAVIAARTGAPRTRPPEVRNVGAPEQESVAEEASDDAGRLARLEAPSSRGLISQFEFYAERQTTHEKLSRGR